MDSLYSHALFSVSPSGMLIYAPGSVSGLAELAWFDHKGKQIGITGESGLYIELAISPDESKVVAVEFRRSNIDLWVFELARGIHTRLTTAGANRYPLWTPDGRSVLYGSSNQSSALSLYRKAVDGESAPELLASSKAGLIPTDVSRDGRFVAITTSSSGSKQDIVIMPLSGDHKLTPFMQTQFNERAARFSPDGKSMAFSSDESGRYEISLAPFPNGGRKWQVSNAGGGTPLWSRDGKEIYFIARDNTIMAANIAMVNGEPKIGIPAPLFKAHPRNFDFGVYDVTRDGRFLISSAPDESTAPLTLISNWPALVKK
jgi:Tol biopolymer transport system component